MAKKNWWESEEAVELRNLLLYTQQQVPSFSPQCFLLEKAGDFQKAIEAGGIAISGPGATAGGKKRKVPVRQLGIDLNTDGEPSNLKYVQKITSLQRSSYEAYFKYTPADIAQMMHYMAVTEALTDQKGTTKESAILNTEQNLRDITAGGVNTILRERARRHGAGIESINVDFVGIDSFTKKQVVLNAKFFFQDIKTMLDDPYASLFKLETSRGTGANKKFRTIDFHIGWNSNNSKIKKEIQRLKQTIRTHLVKYTFDVRQDGSIVVDATYRGYYIEGFSGPQANLLEIAKTRYLEIKQRQEEIEARAAGIKVRNTQNVQTFELRNFVLDKLKIESDREFESQVDAGKTFSPTPALKKAQIESIEKIIETIKEKTQNAIIEDIKSDSGKQKLLMTSAELKLAIPAREKKIAEYVGASDGDISKIIDSVLNLGANLSSAEDIIKQGSNGIKKLWDEVSQSIEDQKKATSKALTTSKSNVKNAAAFSFEEQTRLASLARLKALQIIGERLVSSGDIKYAKIPRDVVKNFKLGAASASKNDINAALNKLNPVPSYVKDTLILSDDDFNNENYQIIPFVFLGNLIENMLNIPAKYKKESGGYVPDPKFTVYNLMKQSGSDVKIDLGLLSYNTPFTGNRVKNLKLYYLPISLEELNNFFNRIVLSKGKTFYSFNEFVNDLLKKFLTGIFSACSKESNSRGIGTPKVETTIGDLPEDNKRTTQYFIHGAKDTVNDLLKSGITRDTFGKYKANLNASIPHFFVFGRTAGIEKNIKLTDIADDQLKTAVYYSPRSSLINDIKGNDQLKRTGFIPAVFQTEIETIGFPIMNLGQLVYVDLKPTIDKNLAKSRPFDASGYYGVHKVSHTITKDSFSTNISAILQISDKDKDIVKQGGLGNLTGDQEGVAGKFIPTSGTGAVTTAWSTSSGTVGATPAPTSTMTPTPSSLEIYAGLLKDEAPIVTAWYNAMKFGFEKGFGSIDFGTKIDSSDAEIKSALASFISPTRPDEKPAARAYFQFGPGFTDYFEKANKGTAASPARLKGFIDGRDIQTGGALDATKLTSALESRPFTKDGVSQVDNYLDSLSSDDIEKLKDISDVPHFMMVRQFDDGTVEINFVEIAIY